VTRGELTRQLADMLGAPHEARFIVEDVLGSSAQGAAGDPTADEVARAFSFGQRRQGGEPLQYVLGHWAFRALDLLVDSRVLIPRPETEQVVEVALAELQALSAPSPVIVDAGTGSGAIALSLASEWSGGSGQLYAVDASREALDVARANLDRTRRQCNSMLPVTFVEGSWLEALPGAWLGAIALVVANPPYVAEAEWTALPEEVRAEPRLALVAADGSDGTPGLADVEAVLMQSLAWLSRPGRVVIELAPHQMAAATRMAEALGYDEVSVVRDLAGRERVLVGRLG
jgi:release factor glutamine methyltransferase